MPSTDEALRSETILGIIVAVLFALLYLVFSTMLTGGSTIYWSPPWSPGAALAYAAGGVLVQAGFCFFRGNNGTLLGLGAQVVTGFVYLALTLTTGELYQS